MLQPLYVEESLNIFCLAISMPIKSEGIQLYPCIQWLATYANRIPGLIQSP
jgi:hypothetical protein